MRRESGCGGELSEGGTGLKSERAVENQGWPSCTDAFMWLHLLAYPASPSHAFSLVQHPLLRRPRSITCTCTTLPAGLRSNYHHQRAYQPYWCITVESRKNPDPTFFRAVTATGGRSRPGWGVATCPPCIAARPQPSLAESDTLSSGESVPSHWSDLETGPNPAIVSSTMPSLTRPSTFTSPATAPRHGGCWTRVYASMELI